MAKKSTTTVKVRRRDETRHKNKKTSIGNSTRTKKHGKQSRLYRKKYRGQGK
jgi:hypothetical protein